MPFFIPPSEWSKPRASQQLMWQFGMGRCTANLGRAGVSALRDWSSKDPPTSWLETPEDDSELLDSGDRVVTFGWIGMMKKKSVCAVKMHSLCWLPHSFSIQYVHSLSTLYIHSLCCNVQHDQKLGGRYGSPSCLMLSDYDDGSHQMDAPFSRKVGDDQLSKSFRQTPSPFGLAFRTMAISLSRIQLYKSRPRWPKTKTKWFLATLSKWTVQICPLELKNWKTSRPSSGNGSEPHHPLPHLHRSTMA